MKKIFSITTLLFLGLSAEAAMITITAVGTELNSTKPVHYTFLYDFDRPGFGYINGKKQYAYDLYNDTVGIDYFYTEFIGEYILPDTRNTASVEETHLGSDLVYGSATYPSILLAGKGSHYVQIYNETIPIKSWETNTPLIGIEELYLNGIVKSKQSRLVITSITGTVPEPSVALFTILGCMCIIVAGRIRAAIIYQISAK